MKVEGRGLREHLRLLAPLFAVIAAVWVLRMVLYAVEAPYTLLRWCSVTLAEAACVLLAVILIHVRRFGSYSSVFLAAFVLSFWEHGLISAAIAFAMLTKTSNVYLAPEFAPHMASPAWHLMGHMTFGLGFGTLAGGAMGCLLLWWLRRLEPVKSS